MTSSDFHLSGANVLSFCSEETNSATPFTGQFNKEKRLGSSIPSCVVTDVNIDLTVSSR